MLTKKIAAQLIAGLFIALPGMALAQGKANPAPASEALAAMPLERLIEKYTALAGSEDNATSLVEGLRTGTEVTLTGAFSPPAIPIDPGAPPIAMPIAVPIIGGGGGTISFTPPTGTMGVGTVNIALALAAAQLKNLGIASPSPEQVRDVLMGGTVNGSQVEGILTMRAGGQGWGAIADALNQPLGDVVRSARSL